MEDNRKIGVVIPTYNRAKMTIDLIETLRHYDFIEEIVVVDDCSTDGSFEKLICYTCPSGCVAPEKVKLYKNDINKDCYFNKHETALKSNSEWICILDSDNSFGDDYFKAIFAQAWDKNTILAPEFLKPAFNFTKWSGLTLSKENVAQYANTSVVDTACNAFNLFINREEYLNTWDGSINPGTFDSLYFSYCWLAKGNKIHITPNMWYEHKLHEDKSNHFSTHQHKYAGFFNQLMNKIKQLS